MEGGGAPLGNGIRHRQPRDLVTEAQATGVRHEESCADDVVEGLTGRGHDVGEQRRVDAVAGQRSSVEELARGRVEGCDAGEHGIPGGRRQVAAVAPHHLGDEVGGCPR